MPWTKDNPPDVAKNWSETEKVKCVKAANSVLEEDGTDKEAIQACINAAGRSEEKGSMDEGNGYEVKALGTSWFEFKSDQDREQGIVTHLISVYGVVDLLGDIAHKGMFSKTITERGNQIKVVDSHRFDSVMAVIGKPVDLWEVDRKGLPEQVKQRYPQATGGLMARTQFLLDTPEGLGAFKRIKAGAVDGFSFAYKALDFDYERKGGRRIRNLRTVKVREYGPTLLPVNPAAVAVAAKSLTSARQKHAWLAQYELYKSMSLSRKVQEANNAFYMQISREEPGNYYVQEVYDNFLVVVEMTTKGTKYYSVPYEITDEGFTFPQPSPSEWEEGEYQFVTKSSTNTEEQDMEEEQKAVAETPSFEDKILQLELAAAELERDLR